MKRQVWIVYIPHIDIIEIDIGPYSGLPDVYETVSRLEWENQGGE